MGKQTTDPSIHIVCICLTPLDYAYTMKLRARNEDLLINYSLLFKIPNPSQAPLLVTFGITGLNPETLGRGWM